MQLFVFCYYINKNPKHQCCHACTSSHPTFRECILTHNDAYNKFYYTHMQHYQDILLLNKIIREQVESVMIIKNIVIWVLYRAIYSIYNIRRVKAKVDE